MENDEVLEEILRYAPKEEVTFVNGVLGGNQWQDNVGRNVKGGKIGAHSGSEIDNKDEIITLNSEMWNLEDRLEKLEKCENGASTSDVVYFGGKCFRDTNIPWPW